MDRTHSIMRIATTASPVSGAAIRGRIINLAIEAQFMRANNIISKFIDRRIQDAAKLARTMTRESRRSTNDLLRVSRESSIGDNLRVDEEFKDAMLYVKEPPHPPPVTSSSRQFFYGGTKV